MVCPISHHLTGGLLYLDFFHPAQLTHTRTQEKQVVVFLFSEKSSILKLDFTYSRRFPHHKVTFNIIPSKINDTVQQITQCRETTRNNA